MEGRIAKTLKTMALLEQPFIKDTDKTVATLIKEAVSTLGENIQVRRFDRCIRKTRRHVVLSSMEKGRAVARQYRKASAVQVVLYGRVTKAGLHLCTCTYSC